MMKKIYYIFTAVLLVMCFTACDAPFKNKDFVDNSIYTIIVESADSTMGEVDGMGNYKAGTEITLTATPVKHREFTCWQDNDSINPRKVKVTRDSTFVASFAWKNYTLAAVPNDTVLGSVTGSGVYRALDTVTVIATPAAGCRFVGWQGLNSKDSVVEVVMEKDYTVTAQFMTNRHTVVVQSSDIIMGTVVGSDTYNELDIAVLEAIPNKGYRFVNWSDGVTDNPREIVVMEDITLTANFEALTHTIAVDVNDAEMGSVTGGGDYKTAEVATLTATANDGYKFVRWSDGVTSNPRKITVTQSLNLTAEFTAIIYTITVSVNDATMGSVTGGGAYNANTKVSLTATAKSGYAFIRWSDGNTDNPRQVSVTKDASYTAIFEYVQVISGSQNGYEYVDLGLPSGNLWAVHNIGASFPEQYGYYYAWGETATKSNYTWRTYKHCSGTSFTLTKYNLDADYGVVDNKTILDLADDVAHVRYGGNWCMPTWYDVEELQTHCTWAATTKNGISGYLGVAPNGNSIFFPLAGIYESTAVTAVGTFGGFWSSSAMVNYGPEAGWLVYFGDKPFSYDAEKKFLGYPVRPIWTQQTREYYTISAISSNNKLGYVTGGDTYQVGTTVTLTAYPQEGYQFVQWSDGVTDNPRTIVVTEDITLTADFEFPNPHNGHRYVDLGLPSGTLWATCNVGAKKPEEFGDYFAWGETTTKEVYDWSTYKYCNGSHNTLTKYCTYCYGPNRYGTDDDKTVLESVDDAATANWGGNWRMPTNAEQDELVKECTWTKTTLNGVTGYNFTGKNGNSIFLPMTNYLVGTSLGSVGERGCYCSSTLSGMPYTVHCLHLFEGDIDNINSTGREVGRPVRPVCSPQ